MKQFERLQGKTILLIEDEKVIRENIASMLQFFFKEVYIAVDGFDGLDKYEEHIPDIIMTDLKMPNMNGFELIEELKKRSSMAYTIIVSAHTDTKFLIDAIHKGVDRYIIKPINEEQLFEAFTAYLEKLESELPETITLAENLAIDLENQMVLHKQGSLHLTKKEVLLLKLLCSHIDKTCTYAQIEDQVWGNKSMSLSALRSVVRDLRKKLGQEYIINVSGSGYKLK